MAKIDLSNFDKIIVLDFGSQYNQLITRRIRDFGIYSELLPHTITAEEVKKIAPKGIIFSGGPGRLKRPGKLNTAQPTLKSRKLTARFTRACQKSRLSG